MSVHIAHRGLDREAPLLLRDVLLEDVRLDRAAQPIARDARALRGGDVEGEHDRRGRVDRHRHRDRSEVDPREERLHVLERVDRDALAADLAEAPRVIGVVAHERGHVEGRREARLAVLEQVAKARVRLLRGAEARELAHRPQPPAVHRRVDAARVGVLAGRADLAPHVLAGRRARARARRRAYAAPARAAASASAAGGCLAVSRRVRGTLLGRAHPAAELRADAPCAAARIASH